MNIEKAVMDYLDKQGTTYWGNWYNLPNDYKAAKDFILDLLIDLGVTQELREEDEAQV